MARSALYWLLCLTNCLTPVSPARAQWATNEQVVRKVREVGGPMDKLPVHALARLGSLCFAHAEPLEALAVSPDGRMIAGKEKDGSVRLWEFKTGKEKTRGINKFGPFTGPLCFSPDGRFLAVRGSKVDLWDLKNDKPILLSEGNPKRSERAVVAFSPDGKWLAVAESGAKKVVVWDLHQRVIGLEFDKNPNDVHLLAFSDSGKHLLCGSRIDGVSSINCWQTEGGAGCAPFSPPSVAGVVGFALSTDGKMLTAVCADHEVFEWDVRTGKRTSRWQLRCRPDERITWTDGRRAITCEFSTATLWNLEDGQKWCEVNLGERRSAQFALTPDGQVLVVATPNRGLLKWEIGTGKRLDELASHNATICKVRFSPTGDMVASIDAAGRMVWWSLLTGNNMFVTDADCATRPQTSFTFTPDGKRLFLNSGLDRAVRMWDVCARKKDATYGESWSGVTSVDVSPDGRRALFTNSDLQLDRLWSVRTNERIVTLLNDPLKRGEETRAAAQVFLADGATIAALYSDHLRFVDVSTAETLSWLRVSYETGRDEERITRFSPESLRLSSNRWVLAATTIGPRVDRWGRVTKQSSLAHVVLWDLATGNQIRRVFPTPHQLAIADAACSPDGRVLATVIEDISAIELWDVRTGEKLATLRGHLGGVTSLDFSPDGRTLASGSADRTILLWDVSRLVPGVPVPSEEQLPRLWRDLAAREPLVAMEMSAALVAAREKAVALLAAQLRPVIKPDDATIRGLLAGLESRDFQTRDRATRELARLGAVVEAEMRRALAAEPKLDVERRLQTLLDELRQWIQHPETLRALRAVHVLERIGSVEATSVLKDLASGDGKSPVTREARAARERLRHRLALTGPFDPPGGGKPIATDEHR